jgi:hypothetical protein
MFIEITYELSYRQGRFITSPWRLAVLRLPRRHLNFHTLFWGQTPCRGRPAGLQANIKRLPRRPPQFAAALSAHPCVRRGLSLPYWSRRPTGGGYAQTRFHLTPSETAAFPRRIRCAIMRWIQVIQIKSKKNEGVCRFCSLTVKFLRRYHKKCYNRRDNRVIMRMNDAKY